MKNCQPKAQSPLLIISFIMIFYKPIYLIKVILRVSLLSIVGVNTSYKGRGDSNTYYFLPINFFELLNSHWLTIVIKNLQPPGFTMGYLFYFLFFLHRVSNVVSNLKLLIHPLARKLWVFEHKCRPHCGTIDTGVH